MSLRSKYFIILILITASVLSMGLLLIYTDAKAYLINTLSRETVTLGRTISSSIILDHNGVFSLQMNEEEHSDLRNYLKHIYESDNTIRHINVILLDNQTPIPLLVSGDSGTYELKSNSNIQIAIATGETSYDRGIRIINNAQVMGAVVPIIKNSKLIGLVCVDLVADNLASALRRLNQYTIIVSIIALALAIITCFKTSEVLADRKELYSGSVNSLVDSINAKDSYTRQHSLNVARYATIIAKELRLSSQDIKAVNILARLHDVGKIGISDDILRKPSPLNEDELSIMRLHPVIGAQILENIKQMRRHLTIVRNHHERFDGKGYPDGLKGEEIPLVARILTVADAFDAMTTDRPYRAAMSFCEALSELEKYAGTQFDPLVVQAFLRAFDPQKIYIDSNREGMIK